MRRISLALLFCLTIAGGLAGFALCGCTSKPKPAPAKTTAKVKPRTIQVGTVAVVDSLKRFVLVDLESNLYLPEPGVTLRAMRDSIETAKLKVTPERKRPFIAADILEGEPAIGDQVVR